MRVSLLICLGLLLASFLYYFASRYVRPMGIKLVGNDISGGITAKRGIRGDYAIMIARIKIKTINLPQIKFMALGKEMHFPGGVLNSFNSGSVAVAGVEVMGIPNYIEKNKPLDHISHQSLCYIVNDGISVELLIYNKGLGSIDRICSTIAAEGNVNNRMLIVNFNSIVIPESWGVKAMDTQGAIIDMRRIELVRGDSLIKYGAAQQSTSAN